MNKILFVISLLYFISPNNIYAEEFNLISGIENIEIENLQNGDRVNFLSPSYRSHCCTIRNKTSPQSVVFENAFSFGNLQIIQANRGNDYPFIALIGNVSGANRKCFYYESEIENTGIARILLPIEISGNINTPTNLQCEETTLSGGFNTSVSEFNFLEIKNNLSQSFYSSGVIRGKIIINDSITNTKLSEQEFQLQPQTRRDIDIHSISGPGKFGTINIYHDGPPDSLSAITTQYKIKNQNPLEFEPVAQQKFRTPGKRR